METKFSLILFLEIETRCLIGDELCYLTKTSNCGRILYPITPKLVRDGLLGVTASQAFFGWKFEKIL